MSSGLLSSNQNLPYKTAYGEIVNINLVRDKKTGKSKGFCFLCYEDQRSTILAVDNFNGIKIKGRTIRVDHVSNYRAPKESDEMDDVTRQLQEKGCGAHTPPPSSSEGSEDDKPTKSKKDKKEKKKKKKEKTNQEEQARQPPSSSPPRSRMVKEKDDFGPKKYSSKTLERERVQNPESRVGRKQYPGSLEVSTSCHGRAEDPEKVPRKEKLRHEHKFSSRREVREDKNRDRDRGRSSDTHSSRRSGYSEGHRHRSRSRSRGKSHTHRKVHHSQDREEQERERESSNPRDRRRH
ncbi:RNA-binding motif protein, X-linked 2 isoform X1 [Cavia porcellus]|uniref:RNA-binding motif protein, X-linked 2 isoform X1 n=1 Tax=Cavia porcellus TaxID=10141 RepID=UPI002FE381D9